jgi:hypothetical protein
MQVPDFTVPELEAIIAQRTLPAAVPAAAAAAARARAAAPLAMLYDALRASPVAELRITMREVLKILRRHAVLHMPLPQAALLVLAPRLEPGSPAAAALLSHLQAIGGEWARLQLPADGDFRMQQLERAGAGGGGRVRFGYAPLGAGAGSCHVDLPGELSGSPVCADPAGMPAVMRRSLVLLAFAVAAGEPIMLQGPTGFKSKLLEVWAQITGQAQDAVQVFLSPGEPRKP